METLETNFQSNESIVINDEIKGYLIESANWSKFLSISAFIGFALFVVYLIIISLAGLPYPDYANSNTQKGSLLGASLLVLVMAVIGFFPIYYLYKYSKGIKLGIDTNNHELLFTGFKFLKSHYKFLAILVIIFISIMALMLVLPFIAILIKQFL